MAKEFAVKFYKSKAWLECRDGFIQSVHGLCNRCGNPGYIVHHKELLTPDNINNPNVTLNWDKLEYLCQCCHNKEHMSNNDKAINNGLRFDSNGQIVKDEN
ncbi:HNH endonuclease [Clostridium omnivorum]|uniref:HNH endonuclease n=1 Tax=Clostridium omnivorum TaxID=1604902 RepID=A0ABQ5NCB9_9CLOT|nr:HNH endonuclease [Clostridium sp. E14]GLC32910.1 hypothetical protein bsdE14_43200 [Clostridium sp. E14]